MAEPKSFASLSSGLLARKGKARPAMRPQMITTSSTLEDLGWNDMGFEPAPVQEEANEHLQQIETEAVDANPVARVQGNIADAFVQMPALTSRMIRKPAAPVVLASVKAPRAAPGVKGKAAFTLRLDHERHLKLRLACAINHQSAQQLVTEALDAYLATLPEVDVSAWSGKTCN